MYNGGVTLYYNSQIGRLIANITPFYPEIMKGSNTQSAKEIKIGVISI